MERPRGGFHPQGVGQGLDAPFPTSQRGVGSSGGQSSAASARAWALATLMAAYFRLAPSLYACLMASRFTGSAQCRENCPPGSTGFRL